MEKEKRRKIKNVNFEGSEKISISLPNFVKVTLESSEKELNEIAELGVNSINSILRFNEILKNQEKRTYIN